MCSPHILFSLYTPMKITVACDSFKGSLSSAGANTACALGITDIIPDCEIDCITLADGGEGTVDAIAANMPGGIFLTPVCCDPSGKPHTARYYALPQISTAIIETADCAGLTLLPPEKRDPWTTSTFGLGMTIADAASRNYRHLIIGLGGSATNDGGTGMLQALGYRFLDHNHQIITETGGRILCRIGSIDSSARLKKLDGIEITALCDVSNPLTGPHGATFVYGPQKGAATDMLMRLEEGMVNYATLISPDIANAPGAGAAGGLGAAMMAFLKAELKPGTNTILSLVNFKERIKDSNLVITGEGKIDNSSLMGKAPYGIATQARLMDIPSLVIAGRIDDTLDRSHFDSIREINPPDTPATIAMQPGTASQNIRRTIAAYLADMHHHS